MRRGPISLVHRARVAKAVVGIATLAMILTQANIAEAHQDPAGCNSTGVSISLGVFRADATTPVGSGTLSDGETIVYRTRLAAPTGSCSYEGGHLTITPPGTTGAVDVTPTGGIPCIGGTAPGCVSFVDSKNVTYVVAWDDEFNLSGQKRVRASTAYGDGITHDGSADGDGVSATTDKTNVVVHPDLHVVKTPDNGSVDAGGFASFTIKVSNDGLASASNVVLTDDLPSSANGQLAWAENPDIPACQISNSHLSCDWQILAAGASVTVTVRAPTSEFDAGKLPNKACASTDSHETHAGVNDGTTDNCDTGDITVGIPHLAITKTVDASPVNTTQPVGFTITLKNTGPGKAFDSQIDDALPGGPGLNWSISPAYPGPGTCSVTGTAPNQDLDCSLGTLASGDTATVHIVSATTKASAGTYTNTAEGDASNAPAVDASATVVVIGPGVSITKTADKALVSTTEPIGFTIGVANSGPGTALGATLNDPLPGGSGVSWSVSPANAACTIAGSAPTQTLSCTLGDLASGSTFAVHVASATTSASAGTYPNTATATATNADPVAASATIVVKAPTLAITKKADASPVTTGDAIGFSITVKNTGGGTAIGATLSDPLPGGSGVSWSISPAYSGPGTCNVTGSAPTQTLSCSFGNLASGAGASLHLASGTTANSAGTYTNTATASATNTPSVNATASIVVQAPALGILKTADAPSVSTTQPIGFTVKVTNGGPATARSATLNDPLPGGTGVNWSISPAYTGAGTCVITGGAPNQTLQCAFGDMPAGSLNTVHVASATTPDSAGLYKNKATAAATNAPQVVASAQELVNPPVLFVKKTADAASVSTTQPIGFTINASNTGTGVAFGATLSDPLPGGPGISWSISPAYSGPGTCAITGTAPQTLACSFGDMAPGASASLHVTSATTADSAGTYSNTATYAAANAVPVSSTAVIVVKAPRLTITKTADQGTISAGMDLGFTIVVTNAGTGTALNATLSDPLPGGEDINWIFPTPYAGPGLCGVAGTAPLQTLDCAFGDLAPGASATVHVISHTTENCGGAFENTATVSATNNKGTASSYAAINVLPDDVNISVTPDAANVRGGNPIGFTFSLTNGGPGTALGEALAATLPSGGGLSWSLAPAYAGPGSCTLNGTALNCSFGDVAAYVTINVHVSSATTAASKGTYTANGTARSRNNPTRYASATINVLGVPKPYIVKTGCPDKVVPGGILTYTLTVGNSGNGDATGVFLTDVLPAGTTIVDADHGTVAANLGSVFWSIGTLVPGSSQTRSLRLRVDAPSGTTLTNTVVLVTDETAPATFTQNALVTIAGAATHGMTYNVDMPPVESTYIYKEYNKVQTTATPSHRTDDAESPTNIQHGPLDLWWTDDFHSISHSSVSDTLSTTTTSTRAAGLDTTGHMITADAFYGVSHTSATKDGASYDSKGSKVLNLKINGETIGDVSTPNSKFVIPGVATIIIYEESGSATTGATNHAEHWVNMIHVKFVDGSSIIVGHAETYANAPSGAACVSSNVRVGPGAPAGTAKRKQGLPALK
jgi:uncharacterized repeat protein (TIGR01451 family)